MNDDWTCPWCHHTLDVRFQPRHPIVCPAIIRLFGRDDFFHDERESVRGTE